MSLKVWLPLDGNLKNNGCSNIVPVQTTSVYGSTGKIGASSLSLYTSSQLSFTIPSLINAKVFSFAFWYKPQTNTAITANWQLVFALGESNTSNTAGRLRIESSYGSVASTYAISIHNNSSYGIANVGYSFSKDWDKWHHIAFTCDGTTCKSYLNGIEFKSEDFLGGKLLGTCYIGSNVNTGPDGLMNDVRIYDHCLSAAEVKEIAQGLILHYKLDGINNASILPSQYQQLEYIESTGTSYFNTGYKFNAEIDSCKVIFKGNDTSNTGMIFASYGTKYFWFYYYGSSGIRIYANNGNDGQKGITGIPSDLIQHTMEFKNKTYYIDNVNKGSLTDTYTDTTNNMWLFSYNNNSYPFKGRIYYVEIKKNNEYQKIFIPAKRLNDSAIGMYDLITNTFYTSSNVAFTAGPVVGTLTIQDSSGYNHNGQMVSNINISSDIMKYNTSALFDGVDDCIIVPYNTICPENIFTINLWFKKDALGSKNYETLFGGPSGFEMDTRSGSATALSLYMANVRGGNAATGLQLNTWYMVTMVRDGTNERYYINGELKKEIEAKTMPIGTYRIGAWNSNTGQNYYGNISDFRIYCTPLLDTDIKSLYNISMKVDKNQNIHNFELIEKNYNIFSATPWCSGFGTHNPITSPFVNFNSNGEAQFTTNGSSAGTNYLEITPGIYEYDYTISVNTGNQLYIGFERYDANKTSRSNNACVYTYSTKPSTDIVKQRYKGTVNLSTDGTNPLKYIALRILNGWSGTTSGVTGQTTIHNFSLRLQSAATNPKITKAGQLIGDEFKEYSNAKFYKDHIIEANQFIER